MNLNSKETTINTDPKPEKEVLIQTIRSAIHKLSAQKVLKPNDLYSISNEIKSLADKLTDDNKETFH